MAASSLGGTLNDLLLRDQFLVLRQWNARHGGAGSPWLRINVPATLRTREDALMPAANALGFAFLTRRGRACDDANALFDSIRRETETIRKYRLGLYFVGGLAMACRVPGAIPWALATPAVVCYRRAEQFGQSAAPCRTAAARRPTRLRRCGVAARRRRAATATTNPAAIAVLSYGGETTVNLRCDPHDFTIGQSEAFLAEYIAQLDRSVRSS